MSQEKIEYAEVIALGFKEKIIEDSVFFNQYGYKHSIIDRKVFKNLYFEWNKSTRLCELVRTDKEGFIILNLPILNFEHLKEMILLLCKNKTK